MIEIRISKDTLLIPPLISNSLVTELESGTKEGYDADKNTQPTERNTCTSVAFSVVVYGDNVLWTKVAL